MYQKELVQRIKKFDEQDWRIWIESVLSGNENPFLSPGHPNQEPEEAFVWMYELLENNKLNQSILLFEEAVADRINAYPKEDTYAYEIDALLSIPIAARSRFLLDKVLFHEFRTGRLSTLKRIGRPYTLHAIVVQALCNILLKEEEVEEILAALVQQINKYEFDLAFYLQALSFSAKFDSRLERFFILLDVIIENLEKESLHEDVRAFYEKNIALEIIRCAEQRPGIFYEAMMKWMNKVCRAHYAFDYKYSKTKIWDVIHKEFYSWFNKFSQDIYLEPKIAALRYIIYCRNVPGVVWYSILKNISIEKQNRLIEMKITHNESSIKNFEERDFSIFDKSEVIALFFTFTNFPFAPDSKLTNIAFDDWLDLLNRLSDSSLKYFLISFCKGETYKLGLELDPKGLLLSFEGQEKIIVVNEIIQGSIRDLKCTEQSEGVQDSLPTLSNLTKLLSERIAEY